MTSQPVCTQCIGDLDLRAFIRENAKERTCTFCAARSARPFAIALNDLASKIREHLCEEYEDAANALPYESAEGGYQGAPCWDTWELFDEVGLDFPRDREDRLRGALAQAIGDETWCEIDPFAPRPSERLGFTWDWFSRTVKHNRRFFFMGKNPPRTNGGPPEVLSMTEFFDWVAGMVRSNRLIQSIQQGQRIFRARFQPHGEEFNTPTRLGPPPTKKAIQSNRMSPSGIVMFYGSEDRGTAVRETPGHVGRYAVGEFELLRPIRVVDLTAIPEPPGLFSGADRDIRHNLIFARRFSKEISLPIERAGREHIEYVPTQILTEFIRTAFRSRPDSVRGIRYWSSVTKGKSIVLFASGADVSGYSDLDRPNQLLRLVGVKVKRKAASKRATSAARRGTRS